MMLDDVMSEYRFVETHATTVDAPAAAVFDAVHRVAAADLPIMRTLMMVRSLPAIVRGHRPFGGSPGPLLEQAVDAGFVLLGEQRDREVVLGLIAQPWKLFAG